MKCAGRRALSDSLLLRQGSQVGGRHAKGCEGLDLLGGMCKRIHDTLCPQYLATANVCSFVEISRYRDFSLCSLSFYIILVSRIDKLGEMTGPSTQFPSPTLEHEYDNYCLGKLRKNYQWRVLLLLIVQKER